MKDKLTPLPLSYFLRRNRGDMGSRSKRFSLKIVDADKRIKCHLRNSSCFSHEESSNNSFLASPYCPSPAPWSPARGHGKPLEENLLRRFVDTFERIACLCEESLKGIEGSNLYFKKS